MPVVQEFNALNKIYTPAEPDVLLFSPLEPSLLVIGTYHLLGDGSRLGSLLLYGLDNTSSSRLLQELECSAAVLDAKWLPSKPEVLVVALSNGSIGLYSLKPDGPRSQLLHIGDSIVSAQSDLVLALATQPSSDTLLSSLSNGEVSIVKVNNGEAVILNSWTAHNLEVWCSAWKDKNVVLTGADDAILKLWDIRDEPFEAKLTSRVHNAGVVAILPHSENLVLTGSYDNCVRLFDYRNLRRPISSLDLDGGVWRILPRPGYESKSFLACCMQSGARTFVLKDESTLERVGVFEPEENRRLIYGGSWQNEKLVALCSFYEKSLYICEIS